MNPKIDMGQVQGAFVMGLGYFLMEEINYSAETGCNLSASTWVRMCNTVNRPIAKNKRCRNIKYQLQKTYLLTFECSCSRMCRIR